MCPMMGQWMTLSHYSGEGYYSTTTTTDDRIKLESILFPGNPTSKNERWCITKNQLLGSPLTGSTRNYPKCVFQDELEFIKPRMCWRRHYLVCRDRSAKWIIRWEARKMLWLHSSEPRADSGRIELHRHVRIPFLEPAGPNPKSSFGPICAFLCWMGKFSPFLLWIQPAGRVLE